MDRTQQLEAALKLWMLTYTTPNLTAAELVKQDAAKATRALGILGLGEKPMKKRIVIQWTETKWNNEPLRPSAPRASGYTIEVRPLTAKASGKAFPVPIRALLWQRTVHRHVRELRNSAGSNAAKAGSASRD